MRNLVASRCRDRQLDRFYGYEKAYMFSTLRKLRGSICKRILIRTHHLLQDFCTNSYELLTHFDAHHERIYFAHKSASKRRIPKFASLIKHEHNTFSATFPEEFITDITH